MKTLLILAVVYAAASAAYPSYKGYKVFEIYPKNENQLKILHNFNDSRYYDFWVAPRSFEKPTTVMVTPGHAKSLVKILKRANIDYSILIDDVKKSVTAERNRQRAGHRVNRGGISFDTYHRYQTIQDYILKLAEEYPDIVSVEEIGTSYEKRTMRMIKIGAGDVTKPIILIDGGIHAREWISPAFVTYIIHHLVENEEYRYMIKNVTWYIIPVLNPDGYEYTHTDERFWRKTRSDGDGPCKGVDGNRNFGFHWMEVGASSHECSVTYGGPSAFSEPETAALRDVVNRYKKKIKLYLSFHSYGNYFLYPWGFTQDLPDNADELHTLATNADIAINAVSGTKYTIGSSTNVLYAASGGSADWVNGVAGVQLGYTVELTGGGEWGFDLPASEILNACVETFEGIKVFHSYIQQKFPKVCIQRKPA